MRLERRFVGPPRVLDDAARSAALAELDRGILAATTQRTNDSRLRTVVGALRLWGIPLWPPTPVAFKALAATLKNGPVRFRAYLLLPYRSAAERRGYVLDELAGRSIKDYSRSCLRGLGDLLVLDLFHLSSCQTCLAIELRGSRRDP